jgi:gamma-glutamyltranspeptidase/glutathione hydrolase
VLRDGGNAVDAAITANAVLQVVYPQLNGLGGDLFCLLWDARSERLYGLNASGRAPAAATIERYHALGYETMPPFGIHTVTVPGCPDGWRTLSERFGSVGLPRALASAISYAEEGFPVGPGLHASLVRMDTLPYTHRAFRAHFMPGGAIPAAGSIMRRPELAATLRRLAEVGAEDFYRGELAGRIAEFFAHEGGLIAAEDLAAHTSEWVEPLSVRFGDLDVYELPPNTQGVAALQMLGIAVSDRSGAHERRAAGPDCARLSRRPPRAGLCHARAALRSAWHHRRRHDLPLRGG